MNFAQSGWLVLLILLPILSAVALLTSRLRRQQWTAFVAPRLRDTLLKRSNSLPRSFALFFLLAACAAAIIALARPQGDAGTKTEKSLGRNVMIALDISKSMRVRDVKPDRLTQAKVIIYELLEAMPNERIGFLGFAGTPYLYAPLTIDHSAVRETVEQIDETWAPLGGSDLAAAVHLAAETLKKTGQKNNALVILSDGEKHEGDLDAIIAEAEQAGIYIIAIGVGTEDGSFVPSPNSDQGQMLDRSGHPVISRLQTEVLRKLAEKTKGRFTTADSGLDIPAMVKSVVLGLDAFQMEGRERRISIEFYQWLIFPAILFLSVSIVAGTRWKGIRLIILLATLFLLSPAARAGNVALAKKALIEKNDQQARTTYHQLAETATNPETQARFYLGEATAAYRTEDFRAARTAFSQSLRSSDTKVQATSHAGLGNSLFQLGWKSLSGETYPNEPESLPNLERFDTLVKDALAKLRESETPDQGDTNGYLKFESLITNWTDATRHYDSIRSLFPADKLAEINSKLTRTYLNRLTELLDQEQQDSQQSMPQPQPGEGPPQAGDDPNKPQEGGGGDKGPKKPGAKGKGENTPKDNSDKNGERQKEGEKGDSKKPDPTKDRDKDDKNPNESPQQRAHRILKENADLEKGPLSPGRREFRDAEKDW